MKEKTMSFFLLISLLLAGSYPLKPVKFYRVKFSPKSLPGNRVNIAINVTIPHDFKMAERTGRIANFEKAAGLKKGDFQGRRYNDSDVFKIMEGAAYSLMIKRDPKLEAYMDRLISIIGKAQAPDGYLYTARQVNPRKPPPGAGPARWSNLFTSHELYNVGHMYESAVAYYLATGKDNFLKIALKNADLIYRVFYQGKKCAYPGHQEIEIGLVKLYAITGKEKYLKLANYFLHNRGRCPFRAMFASESDFRVYNDPKYMQAHLPVEEQREAVGHAVRALYMYSVLLDVGTLIDYRPYIDTAFSVWKDIVGRKIYITGGVGSLAEGEAFGKPYELPNKEAYCETCASIANVFFNHRLFLLTGDGKYLDVLERTLYNALFAGISLSGDRFFYVNPLESDGKLERKPWYSCACCPTNLARFLPTLGKYFYALGKNSLYITLYGENTAELEISGKKLKIEERTLYPWDGKIDVNFFPESPVDFSLYLRIPGWSVGKPLPSSLYKFVNPPREKPSVRLNGREIPLRAEKGFLKIKRKWKKGDHLEVSLPMPVLRVKADSRVKDDAGKIALQRGPIVYCFESVDNGKDILKAKMPENVSFKAEYRPDLLGGVVILKGAGFVAVPYYAWDNRGPSRMEVWIRVKQRARRDSNPQPAD